MYVIISVKLIVWYGKNFYVSISSDSINVIDVKLCMVVPLTELYPFVPCSVTLSIFQGHSHVKQFSSVKKKKYVLFGLS